MPLKTRLGASTTGLTLVRFARTGPRPVGLTRPVMLSAPRLATPLRPVTRRLALEPFSVTKPGLVIACDRLEWTP